MANVVFNVRTQESKQQLEKFVDLDMESMYKTYPHKADVDLALFTKEQATDNSGLIYAEGDLDNRAIAVDKQFEKSLDINYSGYKIAKNVNVKAVLQAVHNIFSWMLGERIINPEFGTNLRKYLYEGITPLTEELVNAEIRNCIMRWEPRALIVLIYNVGSINDTENNTMHLLIVYTIPELSDEQYSYSYFYNKVS